MASQSFRVGSRSHGVTIYPWRNPAGALFWRYRSPITGRDVRRKVRARAIADARDELDALARDDAAFWELTRTQRRLMLEIMHRCPTLADLEAYRDHLAASPSEKTARTILEAFVAHKTAEKGHLSQHLRSVEIDLEDFVKFVGPDAKLAGVTADQIMRWHDQRVGGRGWKRRNDCRQNLLALLNFARRRGEIPEEVLRAGRNLTRAAREVSPLIRYANRAEAIFLLRNVREEFRLWMVLGLFAGLRPEEIVPEKGRRRRGLHKEEIDASTRTIYVPREVAGKVKKPRRIPFCEHFEDWLAWAGWEPDHLGPIAQRSAARARETARLGVALDEHFQRAEGWPKDYLRHTYASHRNAVLQNLPQLALELGNSIEIIQDHYNQPLPSAEGSAFFAIVPADLEAAEVIAVDFRAVR